MKKLTKLLCMVLALLLSVSLAACNKEKENTSNPNTITFGYLDAGIGSKPYQALKADFESLYPEYKIILVPTSDMSTVEYQLANNDGLSIYSYNRINKLRDWVDDSLDYLEDLTELCTTKMTLDNRTIKDSLTGNASKVLAKKGEVAGEKIYVIPEYTNITGFVYNKDLFDEHPTWKQKLESMQNIDDFLALCELINSDSSGKIKPLVWCDAADGYLYDFTENLISQYEGIDRMNAFYSYGNDSDDGYHVYDITETETNGSISAGKKLALEKLREVYTKGWVGFDEAANTVQQMIIDKEAAFMVNGCWFENEMGTLIPEGTNLGMAAIPGLNGSSKYYSSEGEKPVLTATYESFYFIPKNNSEERKDAAKVFLLYLSSKRACEIYTNNSNLIRPFDYDLDSTSDTYKNMSTFGKTILNIAKDNTLFTPVSTSVIVLNNHGGLWPGFTGNRIERDVVNNTGKKIDEYLNADFNKAKDSWAVWLEH